MKKILSISFLAVLISCKQTEKKISNSSNNQEINQKPAQKLKTIELDFDFTISVDKEEDFGDFKTYSFLQLTRENETVFIDSSFTEYEFKSKLFPLIVKSGVNAFELLLEINNRPNKNYLKRVFIQNNRIISEDKLPIFESKSVDINNDGIKEYGGYWEHAQIWGENDEFTAYNPILYYTETNNGIKLDSSLTKIQNEKIYGNFYGFSFSEKYEQSAKVIEDFNNELKIIKGEN